jgi:hypothetical protein
MNELERIEADLAFVRETVQRSERAAPASIFVLWGVVIAIGYTLPDVAPSMRAGSGRSLARSEVC